MGARVTERLPPQWTTDSAFDDANARELAELTSVASEVFTSNVTADPASDPLKPVMQSVANPLDLASTREYLLHRPIHEAREWLKNRTQTNATELIHPEDTTDQELINAQNLYIFIDALLISVYSFYNEAAPYKSECPLLSEDFFQLLELKSIFNSKLPIQEKAQRIRDWLQDNQAFLSKVEHLIISTDKLPSVRFLTEIPREINLCENCLSLRIKAPLIKSIVHLAFNNLNQLFLDCRNLQVLCYFQNLPQLAELEISNNRVLKDLSEINGASSLMKLRIANCKFTKVCNLFLSHLHKLYITDNPNLHEIGANVLLRLPQLAKLVLSRNGLERLDIDFTLFEKLVLFDCSGNHFTKVPESLLTYLSQIKRNFVLLLGITDPFDFLQEARTVFKKVPDNYTPNPFINIKEVTSRLPRVDNLRIL